MSINTLRTTIIAIVVLILASGTFFTVPQTRQAIIVQLGDPIRRIHTPGLNMKVPFIQEVILIDNRLLDLDLGSQEIITGDQERLVVDTYTRYLITDSLKYYTTVQGENGARRRLHSIIQGALRDVLGSHSLAALLSDKRAQVMHELKTVVNAATRSNLGIEIMDVRIRRADMPAKNSEAIFRRMATQREVMAKELRSQGAELAQKIRSHAERQRTVIIADAQKKAQLIAADGDSESSRIYAHAYSKDPEFYRFYRALEGYKEAINDDETTFVFGTNNAFFDLLSRGPKSSLNGFNKR